MYFFWCLGESFLAIILVNSVNNHSSHYCNVIYYKKKNLLRTFNFFVLFSEFPLGESTYLDQENMSPHMNSRKILARRGI